MLGSSDKYISNGRRTITLEENDGVYPLPGLVVQPNTTGGVRLNIKVSDQQLFVDDWDQITDYTWGGGSRPTLVGDAQSCLVLIENDTNVEQTLVINAITGNTFKIDFTSRVYYREPASIERYGRKTARIESDLVANQPVLRQYVQEWLNEYNGIGSYTQTPVSYTHLTLPTIPLV